MPVNVADLQARLSLDVAQFQRGLQTAQRDLKGFQGLVDAYGRQVTGTTVGQEAFQAAVEQTGRKFQITGREISQATRATRALAGSLASEVNPALGETISAISLAAMATKGFGIALTALSVGLAVVVTGAILFIRHIKQAEANQRAFNDAMRTGDAARLAGEFGKVNQELQELVELRTRLERMGGPTARTMLEGVAGMTEAQRARGERLGIRQQAAGLGQALIESEADVSRITGEQEADRLAFRRLEREVDLSIRLAEAGKALQELTVATKEFGETAVPTALDSTLALTSALGDFDLAAARANEATKDQIETLVNETIRLEEEARGAVDEWATLARTIEIEVGQGFTAGEQASRAMKNELAALRLELGGDARAADELRIAMDLFGRTLEELTSVERDQVDRLAAMKREMRDLVRLHDDVASVFSSVSQGIDRMVEGVLMGTQTMAEAFQNFFRNIAAQLASNIIRVLLRPVEEALTAMAVRLLNSQITVGGMTTTIGAALGQAAGPAGVVAGGAVGGQTGQMLTALGAVSSIAGGWSALSGTGTAAMQGITGGAAGLGAGLGIGGGVLSLAGMFIPGTAGRVVSGIGGAMSGAQLGMMIGSLAGPIGTVVGGILGAIVGGLFGSGFLGDLFGGGKKKRDIRGISQAEGIAAANSFIEAWNQVTTFSQALEALNRGYAPFPPRQWTIAASRSPERVAAAGGPQIRTGMLAAGFGQQWGFSLADLLDPEVLRTMEVIAGEHGAEQQQPQIAAGIVERIKALLAIVEDIKTVLHELTQEALVLRGVAPGETVAALRAQMAAFKMVLVDLVAGAQSMLDTARVELLTLTDPQAILRQAATVRQLIHERYEGEIALIRSVIDQVRQLAETWGALATGIGQQILGLQTGGFSTLQPAEAFGLTRGRFREAVTGFRAKPTIEAGAQVSTMATLWLQAASQIFARPSREFQTVFAEVLGALREVELEGLEQQADFESVIQELLGEGNTLESLIAQNTERMADALEGLRDDLRGIFEGMGFLPALQGGGTVLRTGAAIVHAGEEVIPAAERAGALVLEAGAVVVQGAANVEETARRVIVALERSMRQGRLRFAVQRAVRGRR